MNARSQLPGFDRFFSLREPTLRIGIFTGVALSAVFSAWLLVANRVPQLERFASLRNLAAAGTLLVLMSIPVCPVPHLTCSHVCFGDSAVGRWRRFATFYWRWISHAWIAAWARFMCLCWPPSPTVPGRASLGCEYLRTCTATTSRGHSSQEPLTPNEATAVFSLWV